MTVASEVISVPPHPDTAEVQPKVDKELRISSIVTEDGVGIGFTDDNDNQTQMIYKNDHNLCMDTFICNDYYLVFQEISGTGTDDDEETDETNNDDDEESIYVFFSAEEW